MDFVGDKCSDRKFDENGLPRFSATNETPDQLLIYEVNGKFVHEVLPIQPETVRDFKAINQKNPEDIIRNERISFFSGTLNEL